jgi:hypothetical protein
VLRPPAESTPGRGPRNHPQTRAVATEARQCGGFEAPPLTLRRTSTNVRGTPRHPLVEVPEPPRARASKPSADARRGHHCGPVRRFRGASANAPAHLNQRARDAQATLVEVPEPPRARASKPPTGTRRGHRGASLRRFRGAPLTLRRTSTNAPAHLNQRGPRSPSSRKARAAAPPRCRT